MANPTLPVRRAWRVTAAFSMLLLVPPAGAQALAPQGCPVFHCTPEATGTMPGTLVNQPKTVKSNGSLGDLRYQGCSGDGRRLACLYASDRAGGTARGTLKLIDASTLQPIWGSAGVPGSYDLSPTTTAGQVPLVFDDGRVAAGDASSLVLYDSAGVAQARIALSGSSNNFGLTPVAPGLAVVSQADGTLTLVDLAAWRAVDSLKLREPGSGGRIALVTPSAGTPGTLYATGFVRRTNHGWLFAVQVDPATRRLALRSSFAFTGRTQASPVIATPSASGLANPLVLLSVPGLNGDRKSRLLGLADDGSALALLWSASTSQPLLVSPSVDPLSHSLFFGHAASAQITQLDLRSGQLLAHFDLQALSGLSAPVALDGHLGSTQDGSVFTLLLSVAVSSAPGGNGQYEIAFAPSADPGRALWVAQIASTGDSSTAAWNLAPAAQPGQWCPVVVGSGSGISRICDD